jgi:hypothetical protein
MSRAFLHANFGRYIAGLVEENEKFGELAYIMINGDYLEFFRFLLEEEKSSIQNILNTILYETDGGNFGHVIIHAFNKNELLSVGCPIHRKTKFNLYDFYMLAKSFGLDIYKREILGAGHLDYLEGVTKSRVINNQVVYYKESYDYIWNDRGAEKLRKMLRAYQPGNLVSPHNKNYSDVTFVFEE